MDLNIYLPDSSGNWKIKGNTILFHKYVDIPVVSIRESGEIWVSLDIRIRKAVIKMVKHLINLNVNFFFTGRLLIHQKHIYECDLEVIIKTYLLALTNKYFFDDIFNTGFDYVTNLTEFMNEYDCHSLFKEPFESIKKSFLYKHTDWISKKSYYKIEKEYIRDFISSLEREIKINIFLGD